MKCAYDLCGIEFEPANPKQKYHTDKCRVYASRAAKESIVTNPSVTKQPFKIVTKRIVTPVTQDPVTQPIVTDKPISVTKVNVTRSANARMLDSIFKRK